MAKSQVKKSSPVKFSQNSNPGIIALALASIGMLIYINTLGHQYTLDDFSVIKDNFVTKKGLNGISTLLTTDYRYGYWTSAGTLYRPISLIMFAIEWSFFPDSPFTGHLINILLYGLTIIILFKLLISYIAKDNLWLTAGICLIFAVHPIHTEVVANIKSRDEILGLLGCLLALYYFLQNNEKYSVWHFALALFFYTVAMFSKESSITFLAIFPLSGLYFTAAPKQKIITSSALMIIPAAVFLLVRQKIIGGNMSLDQTSVLDNFIVGAKDPITKYTSAVMMLGYYLKSFLIPVRLSHEFGFNQIPLASAGDWRFLISMLIHLGMLGYILRKWNEKNLIVFGLAFYLITISVASNLFITIGTSYGERLFYMPGLGLIIALCAFFFQYIKEIPGTSFRQLNPLYKWTLITIAILFSLKTYARNQAWFDSYTLYKTDIENAPNSAKLRFHYALELGKKSMQEKNAALQKDWRLKAIEQDNISLSIYPKYNDPYSHLGLMYYHLKEYQRAAENYKKAIELGDRDPKTFSNMGTLFSEMGQRELAMENYKKAVELDPRFVDARRNLGCLMAMSGKFDEAIKEFETALSYDPNNADILFFMGSAYRDGGNPEKGNEFLEKAYSLKPELRK